MARGTNPGIPLNSQFRGGESDTVREIPPEWRAALDMLVIETPVPYDTEVVDLTAGVLAIKREQKATADSMLRKTYTDTELPATLLERFTDKNKQFGLRTRTFHFIDDFSSVPSPTATTEVQTKNFGNKHFEQIIDDSGDLFVHQVYEESQEDPIPPQFRPIIPISTEEHSEIGLAADPTLSAGDLSKREEQSDAYVKRLLHKFHDLSVLPLTLGRYKMTPEQQIETFTETLDTTFDATAPDEFTLDLDIQQLPGGLFLETRGTVESVFGDLEAETSIPDLVPQEYKGILPLRSLSNTFAGTASAVPSLGPGELSRKERQLTETKMRRTITVRDPNDYPAQLTTYKLTKDKQIATVVGTLDTGLQDLVGQIDELTSEARVENLGNNLSLKIIGTVETLFDAKVATVEIPDLVPESFRPFAQAVEEEVTEAGLITDPPVLGFGEFFRREAQLDLYTKRITTRGRGSISLPAIHINEELTEEFGGGVALRVQTLDITGSGTLTIDEGLTILKSTVTDLGNGLSVKDTLFLLASSWPVIASRLWDPEMWLEYDRTEQVVDAGSSETADPGSNYGWISEVRGIDYVRSKRINISKPTPLYVDFDSARVSYEMKPYRFPGYIEFSGYGYYVRAAEAVIVQHKIRTWWVKASTAPVIAFNKIITADVIINNLTNTGLEYARNVLHDGISIGTIYFPPTTPTATEYALGNQIGTVLTNIVSLYAPGSGYEIGDTLTITGGGHTAVVTVTDIGVSHSVRNWTPLTGTFGWPIGLNGPYAASGGSGSGAEFIVDGFNQPLYDSNRWIGTQRIVAAEVKPEKELYLWRITTEEVEMQ